MIYLISNGVMPTVAAQPPVATGAVIKTMLQLKGVAGISFKIKAYGISGDASVAATPGRIELVETGTVFATVTALAAADVVRKTHVGGPLASQYLSFGINATGFTASAEGTIVATRYLDAPQLVSPTNQFIRPFALGEEPMITADNAIRLRVTFPATINLYAWIEIEP